MATKNIGVIGAGAMGKRIIKKFGELNANIIVCDTSETTLNECKGMPRVAGVTESPIELIRRLGKGEDTTIWMQVAGGKVTNSIVQEIATIAPKFGSLKGATLINGANADPDDAVKNYKLLKEADISSIDAGVAGGPGDVERDNAVIFCGGDEKAFYKALPLFGAVSGSFGYVGTPGSGHRVKTQIHNVLFYARFPINAEVTAAAQHIICWEKTGFGLEDFLRNARDTAKNRMILDTIREINLEGCLSDPRNKDQTEMQLSGSYMPIGNIVGYFNSGGCSLPVISAALDTYSTERADERTALISATLSSLKVSRNFIEEWDNVWDNLDKVIFKSTLPLYVESILNLLRMKEEGVKTEESLRLLSMCPPITEGIPEAIFRAFMTHPPMYTKFVNNLPEIKITPVVRKGIEDAASRGVPMPTTNAVLSMYPEMTKRTLIIYAMAKEILTGHVNA